MPVDYLVVGALATLVMLSASGNMLVMPKVRDGVVMLGALGRILIGMATSVIWDHDHQQAFMAAILVTALVRWFEEGGKFIARAHKDDEYDDRERLRMLRRKLRIAEQNLAYYAPGEAPIHLQVIVDELKRAIAELEGDL